MLIFQYRIEQKGKPQVTSQTASELDVAKKGLGQAMDEARLNTSQRNTVTSVFDALIEKKKLMPSEALFLTKTLLDKEYDITDFLTKTKKTVLDLYDKFGKDEWVCFLGLVRAFKEDKQFGESMKTFDERHGDKKKPLLSASRYTATTLHSALNSDNDSPAFNRQSIMATEKFGSRFNAMRNEILSKSTSGVVN
jgi:hypothetical protein